MAENRQNAPIDENGVADETATAGTGAADGSTPPAAETATDRSELDELRDRYLRLAADFQNYRRRTEQERAGGVELGKSLAVGELLDVFDDFQRTLEAAGKIEGQAAYDALRQGVEMVYRKFEEAFKRLGVEPIAAVGQPFHENEHEALMQQPAPEGTGPGIVLTEFQRGYRMGDRVLRHSKVVVSA